MADSTTHSVIVTGGSRGIGRAVALLAGERGFDVAVSYLSDHRAAEEVVDAVRRGGRRAVAVQGDVAREADVVGLFEVAARELGRLHGLVNSAGVTGGFARVSDLSAEALA